MINLGQISLDHTNDVQSTSDNKSPPYKDFHLMPQFETSKFSRPNQSHLNPSSHKKDHHRQTLFLEGGSKYIPTVASFSEVGEVFHVLKILFLNPLVVVKLVGEHPPPPLLEDFSL